MSDRDDFLNWVNTTLHDAEVAMLNGDLDPRRAVWTRKEPVSVFGALRNSVGQQQLEEAFVFLGQTFSNCTFWEFDLQVCDVIGDMAYTAGIERSSVLMNGAPTSPTLRVTQVYRREDGQWKVAHRHADTVTG
ncbi:nuclear transport factor 2 family protein [Pseudarthrobacter sp902506025]|uniref:nuclear transport factor 2 family protein n=1 Tax=Pseudarthrobacter sp. 902506025 TaxID=3155291 RepID=UPI00344CD4A9